MLFDAHDHLLALVAMILGEESELGVRGRLLQDLFVMLYGNSMYPN